jgi:hypothetical protein
MPGHDIGEQRGQQFIAMKPLDGATLKHLISGKLLPSNLLKMHELKPIQSVTLVAV